MLFFFFFENPHKMLVNNFIWEGEGFVMSLDTENVTEHVAWCNKHY